LTHKKRSPKQSKRASVTRALLEIDWTRYALDPEIEKILSKLDPEYRESIEQSLDGRELLAIARAVKQKGRKGRPTSAKTLSWIERLAKQKARGLHYRALAQEFRPDLPFEKAYEELRNFYRDNRPKIESRAADLPAK
jgi:hypothetical protein